MASSTPFPSTTRQCIALSAGCFCQEQHGGSQVASSLRPRNPGGWGPPAGLAPASQGDRAGCAPGQGGPGAPLGGHSRDACGHAQLQPWEAATHPETPSGPAVHNPLQPPGGLGQRNPQTGLDGGSVLNEASACFPRGGQGHPTCSPGGGPAAKPWAAEEEGASGIRAPWKTRGLSTMALPPGRCPCPLSTPSHS